MSRKQRTEADAKILQELEAIDTSLLDKLTKLRAERLKLSAYHEKASALKEGVKEHIWKRVVADYTARAAKLDREAAPLKVEVQREYKKLRVLRDRISGVQEEARLAKEELEFREAVGELTKDELKEKLEGPHQTLDACERDLSAVDAQKARFVEAFGSEGDLEPVTDPVVPSTSKTEKPVDEPAAAAPEPEAPAEPPAAAAPAAASETTDQPSKPDVTRLVSPDATRVAPPIPADAAGTPADEPDRTFILPRAAVLVSFGDSEPTEYRLGAINYLGRLGENQVQIVRPGVSRRHALIEATRGSFTLKDLGSQNGTFLNGERVSEHVLVDGDRIVIGDAQIVYRIPWPLPGSADSASS